MAVEGLELHAAGFRFHLEGRQHGQILFRSIYSDSRQGVELRERGGVHMKEHGDAFRLYQVLIYVPNSQLELRAKGRESGVLGKAHQPALGWGECGESRGRGGSHSLSLLIAVV